MLCPKWQFKMKNTGFGKARFTLYDIFNPKEFISYERSQGLRIVILSRFTIIYQYFMNSMYSACHPYLLKSVLFKNCLFFIWAEWTPCTETVYIIIILYKHHLFIFMNLNYCTFFTWNEHFYVLEIFGGKYQLHIFCVMQIFL